MTANAKSRRRKSTVAGRVELRFPADLWPWFRKQADSHPDLSDNQVALMLLRELRARELAEDAR